MNPRTTISLVIALLLVVIGIWWAESRPAEEDAAKKRPEAKALFDAAIDALKGFELQIEGGATFAFVMQDGKWEMTAPVAGPSDHFKVEGDAAKVKDLRYAKAYGKNDAERPSPQAAMLEKPQRIVKLTDKDGEVYIVKIGAAQALSNKTYVQKEGGDTIYLVDADLNQELRRSLADYRGKRVAEFQQGDAVRVEVAGKNAYTLVKHDGKWTVEAPLRARADAAKVGNLLRGLSGLTATRFVEDAPAGLRPYGLETPALRLAVTTETKKEKPKPQPPASAPAEPEYEIIAKTVRVAFGATAGDKTFAKIDNPASQPVFEIASSVMDQVNLPLDDLRDKQITAVDTKRAQQIRVTCGGETAELVKAGAKWQFAGGAEGTPAEDAEFAAVDDLLKTIRELKATSFQAAEGAAAGLDSPRATIELTAEGQIEPVRLLVGGLTPSKTDAYIRNENEGFTAVVKAESADALVVRPMSFQNRELVKFNIEHVARLDLVRGGVACALARDERGWKFTAPIAGDAEAVAVGNILTDLSNLRGRRVVGKAAAVAAFGLDQPAAQVTVTVQPPPPPKPAPAEQPANESASQPATQTAETAVSHRLLAGATPPATQPAGLAAASQPAESPAMPPTPQPAVEPAGPDEPPPPILYTVFVSRHEGKVYAMTAGGRTICEVDAKVLNDLEAELLSTQVAVVNSSEAQRLAFGGAAPFAFEKKGNLWELIGEASFPVDAPKVTAVLDALRDLRLVRYVRYAGASLAEFGLDQPAVMLTAEFEAGEPVVLTISAAGPAGDDRYAAASTTPGRVFVLKGDDVKKFAKQVTDFRKAG